MNHKLIVIDTNILISAALSPGGTNFEKWGFDITVTVTGLAIGKQ